MRTDPSPTSTRTVLPVVVTVLAAVAVALLAAGPLERAGALLLGRPWALSRPLADAPSQVPSGPHVFLGTTGGEPMAWDPCSPVRLVVDRHHDVDGADRMLDEAVASLRAATGLDVRIDGSVSLGPDEDPPLRGDGTVPVLVSWSDTGRHPHLRGRVAGYASTWSASGGRWYDRGRVVLDAPQLGRIVEGRGGYDRARAVVLHELGHLVGLDHVDAEGELMQAEGSELSDWGPGDREGLAALGAGGCRKG